MSVFKWDDEIYGIGISAMDEEHKILIGLINALDQHKNDASLEFLERILSTLELYTKNHFAHEERVMARMRYEKLSEHKKQHQNFIKTIKSLESEFKKQTSANQKPDKLVEKTLLFLRDWLTHHILVADRAYSKFLTE